MFWKIIIPPKHVGILFENLSSADFYLARVLGRRASKMAASSTGIREHGASEKRKSWRQASSVRGGWSWEWAQSLIYLAAVFVSSRNAPPFTWRDKNGCEEEYVEPFRVPPGLCMRNEVQYSKWFFILMLIKTHFHKKGCAPGFVLKVRVFGVPY